MVMVNSETTSTCEVVNIQILYEKKNLNYNKGTTENDGATNSGRFMVSNFFEI